MSVVHLQPVTGATGGNVSIAALSAAIRSVGAHPSARRGRAFTSHCRSWALKSTGPPVAPALGWRSSMRLARDHYIRLDSNDYSVHPGVIGRRVEVIADLQRVRVLCEGRVVADHERVWAKHQTLSAEEHVAAARALRAERVGLLRPAPSHDVETRALTDYDTALNLTEDQPTQDGVA